MELFECIGPPSDINGLALGLVFNDQDKSTKLAFTNYTAIEQANDTRSLRGRVASNVLGQTPQGMMCKCHNLNELTINLF